MGNQMKMVHHLNSSSSVTEIQLVHQFGLFASKRKPSAFLGHFWISADPYLLV